MVSRTSASGEVYPILERGGACLICKKRKKRCDGGRPACGPCKKFSTADECSYGPPLPPPKNAKRKDKSSSSEQSAHSVVGTAIASAQGSPTGSAHEHESHSFNNYSHSHPQEPEFVIHQYSPENLSEGDRTDAHDHFSPPVRIKVTTTPEYYSGSSPSSLPEASGSGIVAFNQSGTKRKRWSSDEEGFGGGTEEEEAASYAAANLSFNNIPRQYTATSAQDNRQHLLPNLQTGRSPIEHDFDFSSSSAPPSTYANSNSEPSPLDASVNTIGGSHIGSGFALQSAFSYSIPLPAQRPPQNLSSREKMLESFLAYRERCGCELDPDILRHRMKLAPGSTGAVHPVLIHAIYMISCYFEHLNGYHGWNEQAENYYSTMAHKLMDAVMRPSVHDIDDIIRACALHVWYCFAKGRIVEANYHASGAFRLIGNKQLNAIDGRPPMTPGQALAPGTAVRYEERLSIFWQLYLLDRYPSLLSYSDPTVSEESVANLLPRSYELWTEPRPGSSNPLRNESPLLDLTVKPQSDLAVRVVGITALERAVRLTRNVRHASSRAPYLFPTLWREFESLSVMLQDLYHWVPKLKAAALISPTSSTNDSPFGVPASPPLIQPIPKQASQYVLDLLGEHGIASGNQPTVLSNVQYKPEHIDPGPGVQRPTSPFSRSNLIFVHSALYAAIILIKQCGVKLQTVMTSPNGQRSPIFTRAPVIRDMSISRAANSIAELLQMLGNDFSDMKEVDITIAVAWETASKVMLGQVQDIQQRSMIDPLVQYFGTPSQPTPIQIPSDGSLVGDMGPEYNLDHLVRQHSCLNQALDRMQMIYSVIRHIRC